MKNENKTQYQFLYEETSVVPNSELTILEEGKAVNGASKVVFQARLQEADVRNQNKRKYSNLVCESITSQLAPKATNRNLLLEIDHPMGGDPETQKRRATIVEIKNCGALLRNITFKNGEIIGEIETLSGFKGPDLANLILYDKVDIGFSLRALGAVEPMSDGTLMVKTPIMPITYDVVSNPSHKNAKVMNFMTEGFNDFKTDSSLLYEGADLSILADDNIVVNENAPNIGRFIDNIIKEQFDNIISRQIKFRV